MPAYYDFRIIFDNEQENGTIKKTSEAVLVAGDDDKDARKKLEENWLKEESRKWHIDVIRQTKYVAVID